MTIESNAMVKKKNAGKVPRRRQRRTAHATMADPGKPSTIFEQGRTRLGPALDVAFYYPGHLWYRPDWIKTLLLFFDGIALLVPEYKKGEPEAVDPVLAGPLREMGLLHYLIANQVVNKQATESLAVAIEHLMTLGAFERLRRCPYDHCPRVFPTVIGTAVPRRQYSANIGRGTQSQVFILLVRIRRLGPRPAADQGRRPAGLWIPG